MSRSAIPCGPLAQRIAGTACAALLLSATGCATMAPPPPPELQLRLPPAALGKSLALQEHVRIEVRGNVFELEALLEVDADELRLALLALGQVAARLRWDGRELTEQYAVGWPSHVSGERILTDLQFVHWPPDAIAAALPQGWELSDESGLRELRWHERLIASARTEDPASIALDNWADGYHMRIVSVPLQD